MPQKRLLERTLAVALLSALSLAGSATATGQAPAIDRAAAAACMALGDDARIAQCLQQVAPRSPEQQRADAVLDDPATQAAVEAWSRAYEPAMAAHAQALAQRGDVRSLLGAMMIMPVQDAAAGDAPGVLGLQARGWFARARQLGPTDPLVAWVEVTDCHVLGCDRDAAIARLLQVDGDNAAAHLWANGVAMESGDPRAAREHLHAAAVAPRYQPHSGPLLSLLLDARAGAPVPAMDPRTAAGMQAATGTGTAADWMAMQALGQWAAIALAPMQGVSRFCAPGSAQLARDPGLRADCKAVLSRLAADDSTLPYAEMATRLLIGLDPGLTGQWTPRLRQLAWWREQSLPLLAHRGGTPGAGEYARWVASDGELGAMARLLSHSGIATAPPTEWPLPRQPR
ncbi:hypothetical protein INQ40_00340 [Lysobacter sp. H21R4]|uniref:hypothetical protein n=1 Tax=Lysobacter sp. H21R4 TaxID=2781021 RepID=UPI001887046D|nr:hypothetical protein [Lysobacter sp. H21R4]QOY62814.1 hypothetical protein INQ40_00340 [Lysobacter sp. H21R4]